MTAAGWRDEEEEKGLMCETQGAGDNGQVIVRLWKCKSEMKLRCVAVKCGELENKFRALRNSGASI